MPYPITDKCNGFADKEAERVDEEIFFYTSESDLKLPDNELVAILRESNPEWFDWKSKWFPVPECHNDHQAVLQLRGAAFARHLTKAASMENYKVPGASRELIVLAWLAVICGNNLRK